MKFNCCNVNAKKERGVVLKIEMKKISSNPFIQELKFQDL